jgi:hypothetical protein
MRAIAPTILLGAALALSSCASAEARKNLDIAKSEVAALSSQLETERAAGRDNQALVAALKDAEVKLQQAREEVRRQKIESVAQPAASVVEGVAPVADGFLPGIGGLLVLAAGALRGLGAKKAVA